MTTLRTIPSHIALVAATAAVATLGTSALSTAQADSNTTGTIHACVNNSTGQLRVVDGEPCKNNEHPLDWNMQGPAGPQGPIGPQGTAGLQMVAGIVTPEGEIAFGSPYGGTGFTLAHPATGLYMIDIAPATFPGVRCPVTIAQAWFTDAYIKVVGWVCDSTGYHVTFATSDGADAGFWFQITQLQDNS
jgi:hypothetical protein